MNTFFQGSLLSLRFKKLTQIDTKKVQIMNIINSAKISKRTHILSKKLYNILSKIVIASLFCFHRI